MRSKRQSHRSRNLWISTASLVALLAAWVYVTEVARFVSPVVLPSPQDVYARFVWLVGHRFQGETIFGHTLASMRIVFASWLLALAVGLPLGILMAWVRPVDRLVNPLFQMLRPIPPIAWIPLSIVWFGIADPARIFVVFMAAFSPCVLNAYEGVKSVDSLQARAARTLGARGPTILLEVIVPAATPLLFTGARIALGNAWMTMVAAELLAAREGLGYIMQVARLTLQADIIIVSMIVIGFLGAVFNHMLKLLASKLMPWQPNER